MKFRSLFAIAILAASTVFGADTYFPKGSVSDFEQEWYGKHLAAMKEPVLSPRAGDDTYFAFRILYLPTWNSPVSFRLEKSREGIIRRAVMLSGSGGYKPGKVKNEKSGAVTPEEFAALMEEIKKTGFWDMPAGDDVHGFDGSQLIIETIRNGKHVVFARWTPEHDAANRGLDKLVSFYRHVFRGNGFWGEDSEGR